jgi:thiol-disulfide isomerase/thioredoxin
LEWLKNNQNAKLQKFIQDNGTNSPEIVLPDPYGTEKSLSSLTGKYVLVHFWAGANSGSRVINPVLAELYQKYKNKGFEIYQVSLDQDRTAWLDAIDQDKLNWINVSDLKGCNMAVAAYNIRTIPYNYLLDKNGVIVAQNLQGPELNKVLTGIFK